MNSLQHVINQELNTLPLISQKEVLDFILFLKKTTHAASDSDYLAKNTHIKQTIIDGLNTPLSECSEQLDW